MSSINPLTANLDAATIQAAETLSGLAYDALSPTDPNIQALIKEGWAEVPISGPNTNPEHNYQGIAFYKTINGVTQVIIANRGTMGKGDAASDFDIALGITPPSDGDAEAYYNYVVGWVQGLAPNTSINVIETGHSLGGQEADWVVADNDNSSIPTEAVTFNAPGINAGVAAAATNLDALNIVNAGEGVHIAGTYDGTMVTVSAPSVTVGGSVLVDATTGFALAGGGLLGGVGGAVGALTGLYESAFSYNHKLQRITDYLQSNPALGGVDLQKYAPNQLNQSIVDYLAALSPSQYYALTATQKATLYSRLLNPSGSTNSPTPSNSGDAAETFAAAGDSTSETLTGSLGDVITASWSGTTGTISNNSGYQETLTYNNDGTQIVGDTWSNASGTKGSDTYNPDGSSSTKTTYASGAYATVTDDGQGNITTDYFTKNGIQTRSTWVHSDGTSGTTDKYQDGLTGAGGEVGYVGASMVPNPVHVPEPYATVIQNPDGSYATTGLDPTDTATTTQFGADGSQSSAPTSVASVGGGVNDLAVASTGTADYSLGMETTKQYSSAGNVVGDSWYSANPDGSVNGAGVAVAWANNALCISGSETVNASGVIVKNDLALDGSSYRDTIEGNGHTVSHYDAQGVLLSDQWSNTDGANTTPSVTGSDSFNSDGSGLGTFTDMRDGTSGTVTLNGQGSIVVVNTNASGTTSKDIWNGDGSYEVEMLNADGSTPQATYDYLANGDVTVTDMASDGSIADQQTVAAGLVIDPDGSNFSKIANADGSYSVYYEDAQGDTTAYQCRAKPPRLGCKLQQRRRGRCDQHRADHIKQTTIQ